MNWRQIGRDALVFVAVLACCAVLVVSAKHVADWWLW